MASTESTRVNVIVGVAPIESARERHLRSCPHQIGSVPLPKKCQWPFAEQARRATVSVIGRESPLVQRHSVIPKCTVFASPKPRHPPQATRAKNPAPSTRRDAVTVQDIRVPRPPNDRDSIPAPHHGKPRQDVGVTLTRAGVASNKREHRGNLTRHRDRTPSTSVASDTNFRSAALVPCVQRPKPPRGIRETSIDGEKPRSDHK